MKITEVITDICRLKREVPIRNGRYEYSAEGHVIVRVRTSGGVEGIGFSHAQPGPDLAVYESARALSELAVGLDVFQVEQLDGTPPGRYLCRVVCHTNLFTKRTGGTGAGGGMEEQENLNQLMRDLAIIKEATKRNRVVLREVFAPQRLRFFMLYFATAVVLVSLLFQYSIGQFGSYAALPHLVKLLLSVVIVVLGASIAALKWVSINRSAQRVDRRLSTWTILRDHLRPFILHLYLPLMLLTAGAIIHFASTGHAAYAVGVIAVFMAFCMNYVGMSVGLAEYFAFGYWLFVTGILSMILPAVSVGVWVAICFGGGSYVLLIASAIRERRHTARSRRG